MSTEVWGTLPKAQDEATTIDDEITAYIAQHEADPTAHLGDGESLQEHKNDETVDHPARSVLPDKLHTSILNYTILVDQDGLGDFTTLAESCEYAEANPGQIIKLNKGDSAYVANTQIPTDTIITTDIFKPAEIDLSAAGSYLNICDSEGNPSSNIIIENITFYGHHLNNNYYCEALGVHNLTIRNNKFIDFYNASYPNASIIYSDDPTNIEVYGNTFENCSHIFYLYAAVDFSIHDNNFIDMKKSIVRLVEGSTITIHHNYFYNCAPVGGDYAAIEGVRIIDNIFDHITDKAIEINARYFSIIGNSFIGYGSGGHYIDLGNGASHIVADNGIIANNNFNGISTKHIYLNYAEGITVIGNTNCGIQATANAAGIEIIGNIATGGVTNNAASSEAVHNITGW